MKHQLERAKAENQTILGKMKEQHVKVIEPLIEQVKVREEECTQLKQINKTISNNIKKIQAILRSPMLSQMFQKENANFMTQQSILKAHAEAQDALLLKEFGCQSDKETKTMIQELVRELEWIKEANKESKTYRSRQSGKRVTSTITPMINNLTERLDKLMVD